MKVRPLVKWGAILVVLILVGIFLGVPAYETGVFIIRHEEVRVRSGDVELAATISVPRWGAGPFPAVVSVHGSGQVRRQDLSSDWLEFANAFGVMSFVQSGSQLRK